MLKTWKIFENTVWDKILHGIKFYGFTVVGRTVKLKSVNVHYYVAKILSCLDNRKILNSSIFSTLII